MPGPGFEWIGKEEEKEVLEVLRDRWLFRYGDEKDPAFKRKVKSLEELVEQKFAVKHALAVTSGTAALITALSALGIGPGDEVIVPGYTFIASISSIIVARAVPVLAEIDDSLTLDPADVEKRITPRTKAIMAVHMLGNPCNLSKLQAIAHKRGIILVEDAAQAFGGSYRGKRLGTMGRIGGYSFNIFKTINAGDGGMLVTDDDELYFRAFGYHDQGHFPSRSGVEVGNRSIVGQNYRMNEITGAVLIAQFRRLDDIILRLTQIKKRFKSQIQGIPGLSFRRLNDADGECNTLLTVLLPGRARGGKARGETGNHHRLPVRVARLQQHGADPREENDHGAWLPVQLLVLPLPAGVPEGNAPAHGRSPWTCHQHLRGGSGQGPGRRFRHPPAFHGRGDRSESEGVHHRAQREHLRGQDEEAALPGTISRERVAALASNAGSALYHRGSNVKRAANSPPFHTGSITACTPTAR